MLNDQPCLKDCPDRSAGCGATCERWKKYVETRNEGYDERKRLFEYGDCKRTVIERAVHRVYVKRRK